ncbi:MAG TPA: flagellar assembly protein FliW [Candidatus Wallbacteria bacterium]|nr:flagellar assembly protein FliW [Candidatus Wallbacteria bacterium]
MKIQSKFFGEIEIEENKIITLVDGMLGFEKLKKYILIPHGQDNMFKWLQSTEDAAVCFLVVEPVSFMFNYSLEIADDVVDRIKIRTPEDVIIYSIVVIPEEPSKISANLCGPIVINAVNRMGAQVISSNPEHQVKHYIIEELKKNTARLMTNFATMVNSGKAIAEKLEKTDEAENKNAALASAATAAENK